jgi:hypothetical protein
MPEVSKGTTELKLTPTEFLKAITTAGGELRRTGDRLYLDTVGPIARELDEYFQQHKDDILLSLPDVQEAREALTDTAPAHLLAGADGRVTEASVAQCCQCGGRNWGPTAPAMPEVLPSGEEVLTEVWGCLDCKVRLEGTPAPPMPESADTIPPWAIPSPCPECGKPYRLFVPASPNIPGEPDQAVLICGKCGHTELACPECRRANIVVDAIGRYCVDCRKRSGQPTPTPEPGPCTEPALLPSRRHHLGEPEPPFPCPHCAHDTWLEGIYSWRCKACQHILMKPDGAWPKGLEEKSHFTEEL